MILEEQPLLVAAHRDVLAAFGTLDDKARKEALGLFASPHYKRGTLREVAVWHTNWYDILSLSLSLTLSLRCPIL